MTTYNWDTSLSVGIEKIDNQHKNLFDILNELDDAVGNTSTQLDITEVIQKLDSYIEIHFKTEEHLMKEVHYDRYAVHLQKHEYFIEKVAMLKRDLEHGRPVSALDLLCFLAKWLREHIMNEDKAYEDALKGI